MLHCFFGNSSVGMSWRMVCNMFSGTGWGWVNHALELSGHSFVVSEALGGPFHFGGRYILAGCSPGAASGAGRTVPSASGLAPGASAGSGADSAGCSASASAGGVVGIGFGVLTF